MKLKYLLIPIIALIVLAIPFINFTALSLRNYTSEFEEINSHIIDAKFDSGNVLSFVKDKSDFSILERAINNSELCAIINHPQKGIVYKFQCTNNSSDNFIFSDDKFYLIKILNDNTELLSYEQYADYSKQPIELKNDWYFIEQNITYD
jgi:hypothetical protein